jgi:hypothetical protein
MNEPMLNVGQKAFEEGVEWTACLLFNNSWKNVENII